MLAKSLALASAILAFSRPFEAAQAEQRLIPSWMKNDPGSKGVTIELVADWNEHTNVSDFNGFWAGSMTLIVPAGWSVKIELSNRAKSKQHSLMLTKPYALTEMPEMLRPGMSTPATQKICPSAPSARARTTICISSPCSDTP